MFGNSISSSLKLNNSQVTDCGPNRISSRSVSWNTTGSYLGMACSDRVARIFSVDDSAGAGNSNTNSNTAGGTNAATTSVREVLVISHTAVVMKVRFHPVEATQLCTCAADKSVRLWDVRGAAQRSTGRIELHQGPSPVTIEWGNANAPNNLVVTERDGSIYVYDVRKLGAASAAGIGTNRSPALYHLPNKQFLPESCIFSPDGNYLVVDSSDEQGESLIRVYSWKEGSTATTHESVVSYPSHGPLYAMQFSPNGKYLATGGSDATVGIWDTDSMCCTSTVARHSRFLRSVAFSHDSKILASSTEEENVDLADTANGGALVGLASLSSNNRSKSGAEEIAFHPKEYLLACARTDSTMMGPPATLVKLTISSQS